MGEVSHHPRAGRLVLPRQEPLVDAAPLPLVHFSNREAAWGRLNSQAESAYRLYGRAAPPSLYISGVRAARFRQHSWDSWQSTVVCFFPHLWPHPPNSIVAAPPIVCDFAFVESQSPSAAAETRTCMNLHVSRPPHPSTACSLQDRLQQQDHQLYWWGIRIITFTRPVCIHHCTAFAYPNCSGCSLHSIFCSCPQGRLDAKRQKVFGDAPFYGSMRPLPRSGCRRIIPSSTRMQASPISQITRK